MARVLIVCSDRVGQSMAGPAIRCWEMARILAGAGHQVRLTVPARSDRQSGDFAIHVATERSMAEGERWADVIVVQGLVLTRYPVLAWTQKRLVVDLYDPFPIETLEMHAGRSLELQEAQFWPALSTLLVQMRIGDLYLCASERQRDFWMGTLLAANRLNPTILSQDRTVRRLIELAPFGISAEEPAHSGTPAIKGVLPGIGADARVVIWAGGVYNWFDPLSLLRAWPAVVERIPAARLVFLGLRHPNPTNPEMEMAQRALDLADGLGVRDKTVYFNTSWVPYDRRQDYLLEADLGVSTHFERLETRLSFRTRILDYIWAGLPIVATEGDSFAEWIERTGTGRVVGYEDRDGIVAAVTSLLGEQAQYDGAARRLRAERPSFTWECALRPLVEYCADPWFAPDIAGRKDPSRIPGRVAEGNPPSGLISKLLWYRRQEGTLAVARRLLRRVERQVRRRPPD